ncbi:MAG: 30S ribosomal protein S11 [Coxiellaceae bacterium]|nr:30S ribosomal protein S11 [Coxiellaceae bacterium]
MRQNSPARKKRKHKITEGIAHIKATFNNTLIVITDMSGDKIAQASAGSEGFKGARKSTPFAAQTAAEELAKKLKADCGLTKLAVNVRGPGAGREPAIRGLRSAGVAIHRVTDKTRLPHNGCRPRKKRRV